MTVTPWLRALDLIVGASDLVRRVRKPASAPDDPGASRQSLGQIEARLAAAAVAAIKEAFDRDSKRLEFDRAQIAEEERRAAQAARLERLRLSGERQLAECRMQALVALAAWLVSGVLAIVVRAALDGVAKGVLAAGWLLLLAALAAAFARSARILAWLDALADSGREPALSAPSALRWLLLAGLALSASGILIGL